MPTNLGHTVVKIKNGIIEQPLPANERALVERAYALFEGFRIDTLEQRERAAECRKIFLMEDPNQDPPGTPEVAKTAQLHTLESTVVACVADQMDNMPEAVMIPERAGLEQVAEDLTDIIRYILDRNKFDAYYKARCMDMFITGTAVTQIVWDADMSRGKGEAALILRPIENFYWDPSSDDIQDARALFVASFHPRSWYQEHFPESAQYVVSDVYADEERALNGIQQRSVDDDLADEDILMLEYWYRKYDASKKQYQIHVSYLAGGVLLYCSEREHKHGVYKHGMFPFVLDVFTPIQGKPVGNGMVWGFREMQRAVNRYASYLDTNARMSSKIRLLVNQAAGIDVDDLTDWNKNIIKGDQIGENALRWFQSQPLNGTVAAQMTSFQDQIKLDSGQNQFSRGEGGLGITAASAISALQEAGGKTSRLYTAVLNSGFRAIAEQLLWIVYQFYEEDRKILITGRDDKRREISVGSKRMGGDEPHYTVQVQVQRKNPMRIQAFNETVLSASQMYAQNGTPLPVSTVFDAMNLDGKERIMAILREADARNDQMQTLALQAQQATQTAEQLGAQAQQMAQEIEQLRRVIQEQQQALAPTSTPPQTALQL